MLNDTEHMLVCMAEECSEITQIISKTLRFGLHSTYKEQTNIERLSAEVNDFMGTLEMLIDTGLEINISMEAIAAKRKKILMYMDVARECGTLVKNNS